MASVLVVICGVLVVSALGLFGDNKAAANLMPLVGGEIGNSEQRRKAYIANARHIYAKGYELHKSRAFRITDTDGSSPPVHVPSAMLSAKGDPRREGCPASPFAGRGEAASRRADQHQKGI